MFVGGEGEIGVVVSGGIVIASGLIKVVQKYGMVSEAISQES